MVWMESRDENTRFFHRYAKHRSNLKTIWDIHNEDVSLLTNSKQISEGCGETFSKYPQGYRESIYC